MPGKLFLRGGAFSALLEAVSEGNGVYLILGKVAEEFGFSSVEVEKPGFEDDLRY